jgi:hypothetical protein
MAGSAFCCGTTPITCNGFVALERSRQDSQPSGDDLSLAQYRDPMLAELNAEILLTEAEIQRGADLLDILQLRRSA